MLTINVGESCPKERFISEAIKGRHAEYIVSGVDIFDRDIWSTMDDINTALVDNVVDNGYLLMDLHFSLVGVNEDGTARIMVVASDVSAFLDR